MEIKNSVESIRGFSRDIFAAGKVAVAQLIEKIDTKLADAINGPEDSD